MNETEEMIGRYKCGCHTEMLEINMWRCDGFNQYFFEFWKYGKPENQTFWSRIKYCWKVLLKGEPYTDTIILDQQQVLAIAKDLAKSAIKTSKLTGNINE